MCIEKQTQRWLSQKYLYQHGQIKGWTKEGIWLTTCIASSKSIRRTKFSHQRWKNCTEIWWQHFIIERNFKSWYLGKLNIGTKSWVSVLNFNARRICNKLPELTGLLSGKSYDIICITETWQNSDFSDNLITNNYPYTIHRHDRENRAGDGSAIMINNTYIQLGLHSRKI